LSKTKKIISVKAVFALLFYLLIPSIAIIIIMETYPELSKDRFLNMIRWYIPLSVILVIISQLSINFKKGDGRRFVLNIFYVFLTMLWMYGFVGGGIIITESWGRYQFSIHLWRYLILIIIVAVFNIYYYTLEWRIYKREIKILKKNENIDISSKSEVVLSTQN
jgi:hypothetical protein